MVRIVSEGVELTIGKPTCKRPMWKKARKQPREGDVMLTRASLGEAIVFEHEPGNGSNYRWHMVKAERSFGGMWVFEPHFGWILWWDNHRASSLRVYAGKPSKADKDALVELLESRFDG